ncbi:MAG: hypothetical protein K6T83_12585 [Alicyclobacillus sp.]|nr:hypothetical protein [Alicyclobacillus sp.]
MLLDHWHAYIDPDVIAEPTASGPLNGLTFCVKDAIDVAGTVTGAGHPDWARTHGPAMDHAPCVARLLAAGARLVGKAHTDELMYSLNPSSARVVVEFI